jgi:hypothetical protein
LVGIVMSFLLFSMIGASHATLMSPENGVIRDDRGTALATDDLYWIQDFSLFTNKDFSGLHTLAHILSRPLYRPVSFSIIYFDPSQLS